MLKIKDVSKSFGGIEALSGVTLSLIEGPVYGLIGPNGSGKTTLFNVITGVLQSSSGRCQFEQNNITGIAPHKIARLGIARTYQLVRPFLELTALENVEVGIWFGRAQKPAKLRQGREQALTLLDFVGLGAKHMQTAEELNIGERKRLEIAKALAAEPRLLMFDEVLAGLNPTEVESSLALFRRINQRGVTILMIEHNMKAIMSACEHIFVLNHGKLIAEGAPDRISQDPLVVDAYLGRKNPRLERAGRGRPANA